MFTKIDEWHENRILHRARLQRFSSLPYCHLINDLPSTSELLPADRKIDGKPLLLAKASTQLWTLITTREVISSGENGLKTIALADIDRRIEFRDKEGGVARKDKAKSLMLGLEGVEIWTPSDEVMFAMANILKVFPLAGYEHE
ncbi:hypothetical protein [Variovorax sp. MHTC-1]|uniref:hypothetical protein n=1 Tax=Variovorax sp. MHTC-1 TaxID=2495593 RepID=UPI00163C05B4|nr:hypothetical protein [Variovorax sp. MHTC-1]